MVFFLVSKFAQYVCRKHKWLVLLHYFCVSPHVVHASCQPTVLCVKMALGSGWTDTVFARSDTALD